METKHLNVGVYETTKTFKAIEKHSCVCFDDMTLVAVTGPAGDKEAQEYADLFAAAPELLEVCEAALPILLSRKAQVEKNVGEPLPDDSRLLVAINKACAAIAKAKGSQS